MNVLEAAIIVEEMDLYLYLEPDPALYHIRNALRILRDKTNNPIENELALGAICGMTGREYNALYCLTLDTLARADLIEWGTTILHSWITPEGEKFLEYINDEKNMTLLHQCADEWDKDDPRFFRKE